MATLQAQTVQQMVLQNIDWRTYSRMLHALGEHRAVRMTYDRGTLELMSPLLEHDWDAEFIGLLVRLLTQALSFTIKSGGSVTLRRRRRLRGLEPDRCYWIASEPAVRGKRVLDLRIDPPPDLAIEVDVTNSSLDRMAIYASLGVAEIWRLDGQNLSFHALGVDRRYVIVPESRVLPRVRPQDLLDFMALRQRTDENALSDQFRAWVQQRIAAGWK